MFGLMDIFVGKWSTGKGYNNFCGGWVGGGVNTWVGHVLDTCRLGLFWE